MHRTSINVEKEAMGATHYHNAIKNYLEEFAYSNATERGLFDAFQDTIDKENLMVDGEPLGLGK